jgi:hypothetical protein
MNRTLALLAAVILLAACGPDLRQRGAEFPDSAVQAANDEDQGYEFDSASSEQQVTASFGISGTVPASKVTATLIADKLYRPMALAFKPGEGSLWVVNRGDDSSAVIDNPGKSTAKVNRFSDDSNHFMNNPTQLAFSKTKQEFAVSLDSVNDYNGQAPANYFTGPTLFTSERRYYEGGSQSHLDMLHHSPKSMGIAVGARPSTGAQDMREYWVFNGNSGSIDRYFFNKPHELGGDDHSDGITVRYAVGQLQRAIDVPGHLAFDANSRQLYIVDTGNNRVVRFDTRMPISTAHLIAGYQNETPLYEVPNAKLATVVSGLNKPSGLLIASGRLFVGEYGTGHIKVYTVGGTLKGDLDTGLGANTLTGLAAGPDNKLYALDSKGGRALRLDVAP